MTHCSSDLLGSFLRSVDLLWHIEVVEEFLLFNSEDGVEVDAEDEEHTERSNHPILATEEPVTKEDYYYI